MAQSEIFDGQIPLDDDIIKSVKTTRWTGWTVLGDFQFSKVGESDHGSLPRTPKLNYAPKHTFLH